MYVLTRLSFFGGAFLRASWLAVYEKGAIRVAGAKVGGFLPSNNAPRHADAMVGRRSALIGIWNALAREAMTGAGGRCILRNG